MHSPRTYIVQILGILLLICGYLMSDRPDKYSVMHFNVSAHQEFSGVSDDECYETEFVTVSSSNDHHMHKFRVAKFFSLKTIIPQFSVVYHFKPLLSINYIVPLTENYYFLFCKEINPPPPKAC